MNMPYPPNAPSDGLPLAGMTVIEFCNVAAGPFCGMLLADMGADVIKVEPREGDMLRQWPPFRDGYSENFASLNRNKRSIVLDLKHPGDNATAVGLIERADIVIENNRPGAMARLGLDFERFRESNPKLIYCSLSAFGQTGPRSGEGGFDLTIQALSGIMSVTGEPDGGPVKCGVPVSDFATGLYGAFAVASVAARVRAGGGGGHIDISMMGASLGIAALQTSEYFGSGRDPVRLGHAHPRNAPYQAYDAQDGQFVIAAGNDRLWRSVCDIVGQPELAGDPRFLTTLDRARNQKELAALLSKVFARLTVDELLAHFQEAGVPCGRINSYSAALDDPQVKAMGLVQPLALPNGGRTVTVACPLRIDGAALPIRHAPPALDGDRDAILAMLDTDAQASQRAGGQR